MTNSIKIFLIAALLLTISFSVSAQTITEVELDEDIKPEDLEIGIPKILPDHFLYWFKDGWRRIREFFALSPIAKLRLKQKFASERIIEIKELTKRRADPEIIKKAIGDYGKEAEEIRKRVEKLEIKAKESPELNFFFDKFLYQQILHQRILQRLENQVPEEVFEKIREGREKHLERFKDVMLKLEEKEKISERLEKTFEKIKGSEFKEFKELEMLNELKEKMPVEIRERIKETEEKRLKKFEEKFKEMPPEKRERFEKYLEEISGKKERQLEILENLRFQLQKAPEIQEKLQGFREKILEKIEVRPEMGCPQWVLPRPGFCKEGRVTVEKDPETGCPLPPKCIIPGEIEFPKPVPPILPEKPEFEKPEVCITLWDPVCGKDGKTYSNECFAKSVGVEIDYKGVCKESLPVQPLPEIQVPTFPEKPEEMSKRGCCTPNIEECKAESVVGCKRATEQGICTGWETPCPY